MKRSIARISFVLALLLICVSVTATVHPLPKTANVSEQISALKSIRAAKRLMRKDTGQPSDLRKTASSKGHDEALYGTGYISSSSRYYTGNFTLRKPALVAYEMTFTGKKVLYSLFSGKALSQGAQIVSMSPDTSSFYGGTQVGASYLEPGSYHLFVAYDDYPGSFRFDLYAKYFDTTEIEPNDTPSQAMNLLLDNHVQGLISATDSYDFYRVNVPYDDLLTLQTASTATYVGLGILDGSGNYLVHTQNIQVDGEYENMRSAAVSAPVKAGPNFIVAKKAPCTETENIVMGLLFQGYHSTIASLGPQSVQIHSPRSSISIGEQMRLSTTVMPAGAANVVTWQSSNPTIGTVDESGLVTGVNYGTIKITATTRNGKTDETAIQIKPLLATGLMIRLPVGVVASIGVPIQMEARFSPENTTNKALRWASSKGAVASISADGLLTPLKKGMTTISATTQDGTLIQASCKVQVVSLTQQIIVKGKDSVKAGKTAKYKAQFYPKNANVKKVVWSLSDPSVGTISPKGSLKIHPGAAASAVTVIATAIDGTGVYGTKAVSIR